MPLYDALFSMPWGCTRHEVCGCPETEEEFFAVGDVVLSSEGEWLVDLHGIGAPGGRITVPHRGELRRRAEDALCEAAQRRLDLEALPFAKDAEAP